MLTLGLYHISFPTYLCISMAAALRPRAFGHSIVHNGFSPTETRIPVVSTTSSDRNSHYGAGRCAVPGSENRIAKWDSFALTLNIQIVPWRAQCKCSGTEGISGRYYNNAQTPSPQRSSKEVLTNYTHLIQPLPNTTRAETAFPRVTGTP